MGRTTKVSQPLATTDEMLNAIPAQDMASKQTPISSRGKSVLRCETCGAHTNKRGKPFTTGSLKQHLIKAHRVLHEAPVVCDICGLTTSNDRKLFDTTTLLMHKAKAHPVVALISKRAIRNNATGSRGNPGGRLLS